jgi:hypothetical protein
MDLFLPMECGLSGIKIGSGTSIIAGTLSLTR